MEMKEFTIHRGLCEIEFIDKDMKNIDIDIFEYVWFKIRENYNNPIDNFTIKFTELSQNIDKYKNQNKSLIKSIERMEKIKIRINIKSMKKQKKFTFRYKIFSIGERVKGFIVKFDKKIYKLFDKPKSYNGYYQNYIYYLNTKHSKLLYKFIIGYKFLLQKSFYIKSDTLLTIMNIKSDKSLSYIKSYFIDKSINEINKKTDINISIEKCGYEYRDDMEIIKYKIIINKYTKRRKESDYKGKIDDWLDKIKEEISLSENDNDIPILIFRQKEMSDSLIFINNNYELETIHNGIITHHPKETVEVLNEWIYNESYEEIIYSIKNYNESFRKVCLLSQSELKRRGFT